MVRSRDWISVNQRHLLAVDKGSLSECVLKMAGRFHWSQDIEAAILGYVMEVLMG